MAYECILHQQRGGDTAAAWWRITGARSPMERDGLSKRTDREAVAIAVRRDENVTSPEGSGLPQAACFIASGLIFLLARSLSSVSAFFSSASVCSSSFTTSGWLAALAQEIREP